MKTELGALALIFNEKREVLLQKRVSKYEKLQKYELPGGGVEFGETPEQTVVRECFEELNVKVKVNKLVPLIWTSNYSLPDKDVHAVLIPYLTEIISGTIKLNKLEAEKFQFVDPENINVPILDGVREMIEAALQIM